MAAVSDEARQAGVRVGLPMAQARLVCPEAAFRRGDLDAYGRHSEEVTAVLLAASRRVERPSADEAFVDLTAEGPGDPPPVRAAETIRDELQRRLGLDASLGLASSRLAARIASAWAKPRGLLVVLPGYEHSFLAGKPVSALGAPPHLESALARAGLTTVGQVAECDEAALAAAVGAAAAKHLRAAARGEQEPPIAVAAPPAFLQEEATIRDRRSDRRALEEIADALARRVARRLKPFRLAARAIGVEVRRAADAVRRSDAFSPGLADEDAIAARVRAHPRPAARPGPGRPRAAGAARAPRPADRRRLRSSPPPRPCATRGRIRPCPPARRSPVSRPSARPASSTSWRRRTPRPAARSTTAAPSSSPSPPSSPRSAPTSGSTRSLPASSSATPTPARWPRAPLADVEEIIRSTGFYRAKARSITGFARGLVERHGGEVPRSMAALVPLPGIGRKTANVVLGHAFDVAEGIAVDTHVLRVTNRLGLAEGDDPLDGRGAAHGPRPPRAVDADDRPRSSSTAARSATPAGRPAACARSSPSAPGRAGRPGPRTSRRATGERGARRSPPPRPGGARAPVADRRGSRAARRCPGPAAPGPAGADPGAGGRRSDAPGALAAVVQMTSTTDVERNLAAAESLVEQAAARGAALRRPARELRLPPLRGRARARARRTSTAPGCAGWRPSPAGRASRCSLGSLPERVPGDPRVRNTSVLLGPDGATLAVYRKIHLFDIDLPGMEHLKESRSVVPGDEVVTAPTALGTLGLSICYDLRFPELYRELVAPRGPRAVRPLRVHRADGQGALGGPPARARHREPGLRARPGAGGAPRRRAHVARAGDDRGPVGRGGRPGAGRRGRRAGRARFRAAGAAPAGAAGPAPRPAPAPRRADGGRGLRPPPESPVRALDRRGEMP